MKYKFPNRCYTMMHGHVTPPGIQVCTLIPHQSSHMLRHQRFIVKINKSHFPSSFLSFFHSFMLSFPHIPASPQFTHTHRCPLIIHSIGRVRRSMEMVGTNKFKNSLSLYISLYIFRFTLFAIALTSNCSQH